MSLTQLSDRTQVVEDLIESLSGRMTVTEDTSTKNGARLEKVEEKVAQVIVKIIVIQIDYINRLLKIKITSHSLF